MAETALLVEQRGLVAVLQQLHNAYVQKRKEKVKKIKKKGYQKLCVSKLFEGKERKKKKKWSSEGRNKNFCLKNKNKQERANRETNRQTNARAERDLTEESREEHKLRVKLAEGSALRPVKQ